MKWRRSTQVCNLSGICNLLVFLEKIRLALGMVRLRELRLTSGVCPLCGRTLFVKPDANEWAVRCLRCSAGAVAMAHVSALNSVARTIENKNVYILSSAGPLFDYLSRKSCSLVSSLYFEDVQRGGYKDGIQCQDVQNLTFPDFSFDICVCSEVFEHVPDDVKGFSEIYRVLKPDGVFVFTVPFSGMEKTVERAVLENGEVKNLLPAEYHNDFLRGRVLCFRDYGMDITERLVAAGFDEAIIVTPEDTAGMGYTRPVVIGKRLTRENE